MRVFVGLMFTLCQSIALATDVIPVSTADLSKLWQEYVFDAPADVMSLNHATISAEITSTVKSINVSVGDRVKQNTVLLELDCDAYLIQRSIKLATLDKAKAQLPFAKDQLKRALDLREKKSISHEIVQQRQTELAVAQADLALATQGLKLAERDIAHCQVKAPFDGIITKRLTHLGSFVSSAVPLMELLENRNLEVKANLRVDELAQLQSARHIWLQVADQHYPLKLRTTIEFVDRRSLTVEARLLFVQDDMAIAGSSGRLHWTNQQKYLPASYLVRRASGLGIFINDNNIARFKVMPSAIEGQPFVIDLPADTQLIVDGRQGLQDGDAISIAPR